MDAWNRNSERGNMTAALYVSDSETDGSWQLLFAAGFYPAKDYSHSCFFSFSQEHSGLAGTFRCF